MEENSSKLPRLRVLGVPFNPLGMERALATVEELITGGGFHLVVTLGTEMVMRAQTDSSFREHVDQASLVVPDGIGVVWAARHCGHQAPEKVAGVEMVQEICRRMNYPTYLLGGAPGVAEQAATVLTQRNPNLVIAGFQDGYFQDEDAVVGAIRASGARLVLVGLGSPRQESWLIRNGPRLGDCVGIGVGGTFDVLAGRVDRAPAWMIRLGLEWFHRLLLQPSRWRRMLALPQFALTVLRLGRGAVTPS